ncbi:DoxX family protein [Acidipila rosea]|uniref:Putative oxidoreductase n=1 Tax=Acidipila rosea TaxID=768535 RepID=A0A4R1L6R5_9BACT|nr:DoxX family protein [Acidipila rosea]MBW4043566.1 DoxX family protein [Acidobacteriota bacterium]TCK73865.1 putative oxidoreductase [Acidipila rosea]
MFSWLDRLRPFAVLLTRLTLGAIMIIHGAHKIFPHGALYSFTGMVGHMGLPSWLGYVAAFTEFFGGCLLVLGFLVPLAAAGLALDMAVAILKVHLRHGLTGPQGFEFPLTIFALCVLLLASGSGLLAVDDAVFGRG